MWLIILFFLLKECKVVVFFVVVSLLLEFLKSIFWVVSCFNCFLVDFSCLDRLVFKVFKFVVILDFVFNVFIIVIFFLLIEIMILLMLWMIFIRFVGIDV